MRHTMAVLGICRAIIREHEKLMELDVEVLLIGALTHDIGKIYCYGKFNKQKKKYDYTLTGKMMAHIYRSAQIAEKYFKSHFKKKRTDHLIHCVLAHHGRKEWGSPVIPGTLEAKILHCADYTEAHVHNEDALKQVFNLERK